MNEHDLTNKVKTKLINMVKRGVPLWWFKTWGGPMSIVGIPDILGCCYGRFFAVELKHPDIPAEPSPKQRVVLRAIAKAGGATLVSNSLAEVVGFVEGLVAEGQRREVLGDYLKSEAKWAIDNDLEPE